MKVVLAGYNVDAEVLNEIKQSTALAGRLTPEVLAAAYARISRDPREVTVLRQVALDEVEKARISNRTIIFQMGHHSVAEHAVFNFDIVGLSRLAVEWLERYRLCSFTEKSQRYITLDHDFVIPPEIRGTPFEDRLLSLVNRQAALYEKLYASLMQQLAQDHPGMTEKKRSRTLLEGAAKEDARYVTLLATSGQLGLTVNARNLELLIRRFAAAPIEEVRDLGRRLFEEGSKVAPSLLLFTEASAFDTETRPNLETIASKQVSESQSTLANGDWVRLVKYTPDSDRLIATTLLHVHSHHSFEECRRAVEGMSTDELRKIFEAATRRMEFYDSVPREFEHAKLTYEITLSASAFAQLKRHRMSTQSVQGYRPSLGITVPPAIEALGLSQEVISFARDAECLYRDLLSANPAVAPYALTNAHRRRVLLTTNVRELYHIVRLREDAHAQWDIRNIASRLRSLAEEVMPLSTLLLCGKDQYVDKYRSVFGVEPSITPPA